MKAKKAGRKVLESTERFSQALLEKETVCFRTVESVFTRLVPAVNRASLKAVKASESLTGRWEDTHQRAVTDSMIPVIALASQARQLSSDSILRELTYCEKTLPVAYQGVSETAMTLVPVEQIVSVHLELFRLDCVRLHSHYLSDQQTITLQARTLPELEAKLFSPTPAFGVSRGVWWQTVSSIQERARWVAVSISNRIRLAGMDAFNQIGGDRG